ncbi:DNA/RNA non-specific endonuclease [Thiomicrorhabdus aquaedulcis]|uniref:DNA/RNA non-specific endonuclease n=1 Tax=Thiomicrorhabdus aquaedulcis TaxID=2211106 RepID=UPI000FDAD519|nr:DNA/RNA non-specific endonuclease [Thiomicrorhabdus aquaedulcis]
MLRKLLFASGLLIASFAAQAQYACDQTIEKQGYSACYNYDLKATLYTVHTMRAEDLKKDGLSRDGLKFYEESSIPARYRAKLSDYRSSGFDRSHLVSNDDQNHSAKLQKETFSLVCQSPHWPNVNRVSLLAVEKLIRRLTISNKESIVYSGNIYDRVSPKRIGAGRIAVPTETYKVVHFPTENKTLAFLIPNVPELQSSKASSFRVDVSLIEKKTGFVFK